MKGEINMPTRGIRAIRTRLNKEKLNKPKDTKITPGKEVKKVEEDGVVYIEKIDINPEANSLNAEIGEEVKNFLRWLTAQNHTALEEFSAEELTNFYLTQVEMPPIVKISWIESKASTIASIYEHFTKAKEVPAEYQKPGYYVPRLKIKANFKEISTKTDRSRKAVSDKQIGALKRARLEQNYGVLPELLTSNQASPIIGASKENRPLIKKRRVKK